MVDPVRSMVEIRAAIVAHVVARRRDVAFVGRDIIAHCESLAISGRGAMADKIMLECGFSGQREMRAFVVRALNLAEQRKRANKCGCFEAWAAAESDSAALALIVAAECALKGVAVPVKKPAAVKSAATRLNAALDNAALEISDAELTAFGERVMALAVKRAGANSAAVKIA